MKQTKHIVRDFLILGIAVSGVSFLYRYIKRKEGPLVRVLSFHDVLDSGWFAAVLDLLEQKYYVITPKQFHDQDFHAEKINILLTFDDGYQSWVDICLPELQRRDMKGLFFVNSGLLDISNDEAKVAQFCKEKLLISPKAPLTWEGARELVASGHTIGGHTVNHVRMSKVSLDVAKKECVDDKRRLESMLGIALQDFAYPFGAERDYSKMTMQVAAEAGYTYQFSSLSHFVEDGGREGIIPRTLLEREQSLGSIACWLLGAYDLFVMCKKV